MTDYQKLYESYKKLMESWRQRYYDIKEIVGNYSCTCDSKYTVIEKLRDKNKWCLRCRLERHFLHGR